jgi:hypothetical protein
MHRKNVCAVERTDAEMFLKDVEPMWRAFWFHMHLVAKNLEEFADGLTTISDEVFAYHVSGQKNDLERWTREVIGDAALANELGGVATKEDAARIVADRVKELRAALG